VLSWGRATYDAYAEGLYTYCLSVLRDHDAAAESLRSTFVLADRHIGRLPDLDLLKPWLYALARYECLVRLDAHVRVGDGPARPEDVRVVWAHERSLPPLGGDTDEPTDLFPGTEAGRLPGRRRTDLDELAWPEAVGLAPEPREALELSVRHGLDPRGLGAVLGCDEHRARSVLLAAGREVDRTRAAVAGAEISHGCPEGQELATGRLTSVLRDRLITHVETCRRCGPLVCRAATVLAPTTGAAAVPIGLALIAPPAALRVEVLGEVGKGRSAQRPPEIARRVAEFDRAGFPVFRARVVERGNRRRATVIAAVVVAAVVAAPALALWQAAGGSAGESDARGVTIGSAHVENSAGTGASRPASGGPPTVPERSRGAEHASTSVPNATGGPGTPGAPVGSAPLAASASPPPAGAPAIAPGAVFVPPGPETAARPVPPRVTVTHTRERTVITLFNTGGVPVDWKVASAASWLRPSHARGTLAAGRQDTVTVTVDADHAPKGSWSARIAVEPGGAVVTIEGRTGDPAPSSSTTTTTLPSVETTPATSASPSTTS
jgi:DNA-directed RNA polymerase specialized sigma24 family protein